MSTILTRAGKGAALTGTEYDTNLKKAAQEKTGSYTVIGSDNRDTIEVTGASVITLSAASTLAAEDTGDFEVTIKNTHTKPILVTRSSTDTIDGAVSHAVGPLSSATFKVNQDVDGFYVLGDSPIMMYKTADTARSTNDTPADDTHLQDITLAPDTVYALEFCFLIDDASSTGGFQFGIAATQAPQLGYWSNGAAEYAILTASTDYISYSINSDIELFSGRGMIHTNATTGGDLKFKWAQAVSSAAATTLHKGSWVRLTRLGIA